jgi:SAM-dependent methyltransferase
MASEQKQQSAMSKIRKTIKEKGLLHVSSVIVRSLRRRCSVFFWFNYFRIFKSWKKFTVGQRKYSYFYHKYNKTWLCERTVEIPIVWDIVQKSKGDILEVGNVLSHYYEVHHNIVDKFEKAQDVINQDVVDLCLPKKYDLIISISTLEHVGWDEDPKSHNVIREPEKIIKALDNLRGLLKPNGKIVITLPVGHNRDLDEALKNGTIRFDKQVCLKRISKDNRWVEANWEEVKNLRYDSPFACANGLIIGIIDTAAQTATTPKTLTKTEVISKSSQKATP